MEFEECAKRPVFAHQVTNDTYSIIIQEKVLTTMTAAYKAVPKLFTTEQYFTNDVICDQPD